jgi:LPXTG-motif cell wall-anchored protein
VPKTGDGFNAIFWIVAAAGAAATIPIILITSRKKKGKMSEDGDDTYRPLFPGK